MTRNEKYVLGSSVGIGERTIISVVRVDSIINRGMAFVTLDPAGILVRAGVEYYRIALADHISWDEIGEHIPEVHKYRDSVIKSCDAGSGGAKLSDLPDQGQPRDDEINS